MTQPTSDGPPGRSADRGPVPRLSALFASHTPETSVFRVGSHHLSRQLARMGLLVEHVSTPLSPVKLFGAGDRTGLAARWRTTLRGPTRDALGRVSAVPFTTVPVQLTCTWPVNVALHTAVPPLGRTARLAGVQKFDYLLVDQPMFAGLQRLVPADKVVYRPTDVYESRRLRAAQERLLAEADAVVATSEEVLASLPASARRLPSLVLPNGVDAEAFTAAPAVPADLSAVVYVGALDARTHWTWIDQLARALPGVRIDLFGPVAAPPPAGLSATIHFRGPVDYAHLPQLLAGYAVALMPFAPGQVNGGRSPMKLYEYLAAGLHVVATPHFSQAQDPPPGVSVALDGTAAAVRVRELLTTPGRNTPGVLAAGHEDWSDRAATLLAFLGGL